jgi:hypothetical protein
MPPRRGDQQRHAEQPDLTEPDASSMPLDTGRRRQCRWRSDSTAMKASAVTRSGRIAPGCSNEAVPDETSSRPASKVPCERVGLQTAESPGQRTGDMDDAEIPGLQRKLRQKGDVDSGDARDRKAVEGGHVEGGVEPTRPHDQGKRPAFKLSAVALDGPPRRRLRPDHRVVRRLADHRRLGDLHRRRVAMAKADAPGPAAFHLIAIAARSPGRPAWIVRLSTIMQPGAQP